jgi:hypothetical protein
MSTALVELPRSRGKGMDSDQGWVADDFDAPLPEDLQALFEGKAGTGFPPSRE